MRAARIDFSRATDVLRRAFPEMEIEDIGGRPILMGSVTKLRGESPEQTAGRLFNYLEREVDHHLPERADFIGIGDGDQRALYLKIEPRLDEPDGSWRAISPGRVLFHAGS